MILSDLSDLGQSMVLGPWTLSQCSPAVVLCAKTFSQHQRKHLSFFVLFLPVLSLTSDIYELNVSMLSPRCHDWARCHGNRLPCGCERIRGAERWQRWGCSTACWHKVALFPLTDRTKHHLAFSLFYSRHSPLTSSL